MELSPNDITRLRAIANSRVYKRDDGFLVCGRTRVIQQLPEGDYTEMINYHNNMVDLAKLILSEQEE